VGNFLRAEGYRPADWSRDQSVCARIDDKTDRYPNAITADRARQADIRRSAADMVADLLAARDGPVVVTVAANAGEGKTALLGQILGSLPAKAAADPGDDLPGWCWRLGSSGLTASATRTNSGRPCACPPRAGGRHNGIFSP
jgi:hypothetical protein